MKKLTVVRNLAFACMLACSGGVVAQGYYEPIPYYGDDPFLFCTFGVPADCWVPLNPATGTFVVWDDECFNPVSAAQYARVCPHAFVPLGKAEDEERAYDEETRHLRPSLS